MGPADRALLKSLTKVKGLEVPFSSDKFFAALVEMSWNLWCRMDFASYPMDTQVLLSSQYLKALIFVGVNWELHLRCAGL